MWTRIVLENWRSFDSACVDIGPLTVVVGPNSSGKSNFTDALLFASEVAFDAVAAVDRRGGVAGIRRWSPTKPYLVTIDRRVAKSVDGLDEPDVRHAFTIESGKDGGWSFRREIVDWSDRSGRRRVEREGDEITKDGLGRVLGAKLPATTSAMLLLRQLIEPRRFAALHGTRKIRPDPVAMRVPQEVSDSRVLDPSGANLASVFKRLPERSRARILAIMQRIVPGLGSIEVVSTGRYVTLAFTQALRRGRSATFTAGDMSDGSLRALALAVAARLASQDELLIVEEPEVHLHPGAAQVLYEALSAAAERGSVLVTTHSPELLDAAHDQRILVCDYRNGTSRIGPLAESQRQIVRDGLFSAAELMRADPLRIEGEAPAVVDLDADA